jgi:hypothetical protein
MRVAGTSGTSLVNEVQRVFNGLGQRTQEWQAHGGTVTLSTTPSLPYAHRTQIGSGMFNRRRIWHRGSWPACQAARCPPRTVRPLRCSRVGWGHTEMNRIRAQSCSSFSAHHERKFVSFVA